MNLWRIFKTVFALAIITHAFVHLAVVPGMESEDGGALGWSGESWLLSDSLAHPVHPTTQLNGFLTTGPPSSSTKTP